MLAGASLPEIEELIVKVNSLTIGTGLPLFAHQFEPLRWRPIVSETYDSGVAVTRYRTTSAAR